jgi:hypothetical protein
MRIYLLRRRALVKADPMEEVVVCGAVIGTSLIVGEVVLKGRTRKFLSEEIDLVQEQDLRCTSVRERRQKKKDGHTIDDLTNHRELHIESKRVRASCIRF